MKAPRWAWWVATGLGSGRLRPAPGTWGSLAALAAWVLLNRAPAHPGPVAHALWEIAFLLGPVLLTWAAVAASDLVVAETGLKDPSWIVADEWAGLWIALWPVRWAVPDAHGTWRILLLAVPFLLFRLFDIWKPWPIRQIQVLPGGQGVVADDVVAGLMALPLVALFVGSIDPVLGVLPIPRF